MPSNISRRRWPQVVWIIVKQALSRMPTQQVMAGAPPGVPKAQGRAGLASVAGAHDRLRPLTPVGQAAELRPKKQNTSMVDTAPAKTDWPTLPRSRRAIMVVDRVESVRLMQGHEDEVNERWNQELVKALKAPEVSDELRPACRRHRARVKNWRAASSASPRPGAR